MVGYVAVPEPRRRAGSAGARTPELRKREATIQAQLDTLDAELHDAESYLKLTETLAGFRARLSAHAENLTVQQRQQIIRRVVREVLIGDDDVTIRHSIPVPTGDQPPGYLLRSGSREDATASARPPTRDRGSWSWPSLAPRVRVRARRNGTTTLFAALEVATGAVTDRCYERHGKAEFFDFLKRVAKSYPRRRLHIVLDNHHTHKHDDINQWLAKHPRITLHFTPDIRGPG